MLRVESLKDRVLVRSGWNILCFGKVAGKEEADDMDEGIENGYA